MITNTALIERLLRYVKIDTQSDDEAASQPSTQKQNDLARLLYKELCGMGVPAHYDTQHCYVYAKLPGQEPAIGFVAHMDTSPACSGRDVRPRIVENYQGQNIVLSEQPATAPVVMRTSDFPELLSHIGEDLIVTDGTTLLGSDDKSGVAEIMNLFEYYTSHPEIPHRTICAAFTPDEEVGRGTENFDPEAFGAKQAYTVDGGKLGEIEYECFNAASAKVEITGRGVHPGDAKNTMINASLVGMEFNALLPASDRPEHTEGYEGFYHLIGMEGDVSRAVLKYIVRDHDSGSFAARKELLLRSAAFLNDKYRALAGGDVLRITIKDQYYNMAIPMKDHMELVTGVQKTMQQMGITPIVQPIRGGTDGAALTYLGIPCPNLCTGGYNFHGLYEYASVQEIEKCAELLILLAAV
ncbi:MAG: peptidase T [Lachnospiraceae bacterium]|nr:peptidase T [Lachnospiraceae bacterium]